MKPVWVHIPVAGLSGWDGRESSGETGSGLVSIEKAWLLRWMSTPAF